MVDDSFDTRSHIHMYAPGFHRDFPIEEVIIPGRRHRPLGEIAHVSASVDEIGILHPITLRSDGRLIAGLHRLEVAKKRGDSTIAAFVKDVDDLHAEMIELDENLATVPLTDLQRADMLKRRKEIYEQLHPDTRANVAGGKARQASREGAAAEVAAAPSFVSDTAAKTGRSERSIREDIQIAENLSDETKGIVTGTPMEDRKTDLLELARETDPEEQKAEATEKARTASKRKARAAPRSSSKGRKGNEEKDIEKVLDCLQDAERLLAKYEGRREVIEPFRVRLRDHLGSLKGLVDGDA